MTRTLFRRLLFIIAVSITLYSCVHDEVISSADQPTTKDYASKSPWKEDQVYIKKVQQVFLQNANVTYFEQKYGKVHWDYAMSLGTFDESYLVVPILKDNEVVTVMKVYRIGDRVYFHEKNDPEFIGFFSDVMFKNITNVHEKTEFKTSLTAKTLEFKCTYRTISIGCPEGYDDCGYVPGRTISECNWVDTGGEGGPPKMELCNPMECGGGGGAGGGDTDPGFEYPEPPNTEPCEKIKAQKTNTDFKNKITDLQGKTGLTKETGYIQRANGNYTYQDTAGQSDTSNTLSLPKPDLPENKDIVAYFHTHVDNYTYIDEDGYEITRTGIKMFSPGDMDYFMDMIKNAREAGRLLSDVYAVMVTSTGNYQIRFTGNEYQIKSFTKQQIENLTADFLTFMKGYSDNLELGFLNFISEKMNIKAINLYKMEADGSTKEIKMNSDKKSLTKTDCPT